MKKRKMFLGKLILVSAVCASMSMQALAVSGDELIEVPAAVESLEDSSLVADTTEDLIEVPAEDSIEAPAEDNSLEDSLTIEAVAANAMVDGIIGNGTWSNPYQITKKEDFRLMEQEGDACFALKNNIDFNNESWEPISGFSGDLYGNGYTISNLKIFAPNEDNVGLFKGADGAYIYNLTIKNVDISGRDNVGGFMGDGWDVDMENCKIIGNVKINGRNSVGGFVGDASSMYVYSCFISGMGQITGQDYVGGILGRLDAGVIESTYSTINVKGNDNVGGFIGDFSDGDVTMYSSSTSGNVSGRNNVGGIVGSAWKDGAFDMYECSVSGAISGNDYVGGFGGYIVADGDCEGSRINMVDCYMITTNIKGKSNVNWLVGYKSSNITIYYTVFAEEW